MFWTLALINRRISGRPLRSKTPQLPGLPPQIFLPRPREFSSRDASLPVRFRGLLRARRAPALTLSMQSGLSASTYLFGQSEVDSEEPSLAARGGARLGRCGAVGPVRLGRCFLCVFLQVDTAHMNLIRTVGLGWYREPTGHLEGSNAFRRFSKQKARPSDSCCCAC